MFFHCAAVAAIAGRLDVYIVIVFDRFRLGRSQLLQWLAKTDSGARNAEEAIRLAQVK